MPAVQPLLPLPRPAQARVRSLRRPFTPAKNAGPYRLPHDVRDRLGAALTGYRNRDAALALATFIGRFWTAPRKLGLPFILDRRALAPVEALGLTEARVRGAIRALEAAGYLERMPVSGRTHQRTPDGLHRKPIAFVFGADYRDAFALANRRAQAARERLQRDRRCPGASPAATAVCGRLSGAASVLAQMESKRSV